MAEIDFDLGRYIAYRKGRVLQRARDGAAYGFSKEIRSRRNLLSLRPAAFAIDATSRQWNAAAKKKILSDAVLATSVTHSRLYHAGQEAMKCLNLEGCPPIYVSDSSDPLGIFALGTEDDTVILIHPTWLDALSDPELLATVGHALGHVQNNLVPYRTALYYLENDTVFFVRWVITPAIMALRSWAQRADVTCDRASVICSKNPGISAAAILRTAGAYSGPLDYEGLAAGNYGAAVNKLLENNKHLRHRIAALHVFAESYLYSQMIGKPNPKAITTEAADDRVAQILAE